MDSTDEIARLITEWRAEVTEQAQRFDAARGALDEVSVTETTAGGAIVVTVGSAGTPTELWLGDDVGRMKPDQVAAQIMACLRRAQARLADRVAVVVTDTMGDAAGAEAVVDEYRNRFPPPADVDDAPLAPLEENADFGLSDMDIEMSPPAAPARPRRHTPTRNEDEDWETSPW